MSAISAEAVKKLRDMTSLPMMECKAALTEAKEVTNGRYRAENDNHEIPCPGCRKELIGSHRTSGRM